MDAWFHEYLRARRAEVDAALTAALPQVPDCPAVVADAMRYSVTAGGKRLRPILCLAAAEAVGGDRTRAMPAACALELIHTYSLIHDDLPAMDNDAMRRGRPTLHVVVGEGMAILAGDGLLTEAFVLLARAPEPSDPAMATRMLRVTGVIAAAAGATGMVGGQAIDLASSVPGAELLDADALRIMHSKKTGALIRAAAVAGAVMGGAVDATLEGVEAAGAEFGLAFQIVDDILDVEGHSAQLGKTAGKDAAAGKPTYPAFYGLEAARSMAADCLARAHDALAGVDLADSRLMDIGRWIVNRSH
jgi:geranylgeranyl diphosphate synthase, type II